jgi:hypothetical protein
MAKQFPGKSAVLVPTLYMPSRQFEKAVAVLQHLKTIF